LTIFTKSLAVLVSVTRITTCNGSPSPRLKIKRTRKRKGKNTDPFRLTLRRALRAALAMLVVVGDQLESELVGRLHAIDEVDEAVRKRRLSWKKKTKNLRQRREQK
jgi:hypothetical protein